MTDHSKSDAYDLIRTDIQLFLRTYKRRVQADAEGEYDKLVSNHMRLFPDKPVDHLALAREALSQSISLWLPEAPQAAIEAA